MVGLNLKNLCYLHAKLIDLVINSFPHFYLLSNSLRKVTVVPVPCFLISAVSLLNILSQTQQREIFSKPQVFLAFIYLAVLGCNQTNR